VGARAQGRVRELQAVFLAELRIAGDSTLRNKLTVIDEIRRSPGGVTKAVEFLTPPRWGIGRKSRLPGKGLGPHPAQLSIPPCDSNQALSWHG